MDQLERQSHALGISVEAEFYKMKEEAGNLNIALNEHLDRLRAAAEAAAPPAPPKPLVLGRTAAALMTLSASRVDLTAVPEIDPDIDYLADVYIKPEPLDDDHPFSPPPFASPSRNNNIAAAVIRTVQDLAQAQAHPAAPPTAPVPVANRPLTAPRPISKPKPLSARAPPPPHDYTLDPTPDASGTGTRTHTLLITNLKRQISELYAPCSMRREAYFLGLSTEDQAETIRMLRLELGESVRMYEERLREERMRGVEEESEAWEVEGGEEEWEEEDEGEEEDWEIFGGNGDGGTPGPDLGREVADANSVLTPGLARRLREEQQRADEAEAVEMPEAPEVKIVVEVPQYVGKDN